MPSRKRKANSNFKGHDLLNHPVRFSAVSKIVTLVTVFYMLAVPFAVLPFANKYSNSPQVLNVDLDGYANLTPENEVIVQSNPEYPVIAVNETFYEGEDSFLSGRSTRNGLINAGYDRDVNSSSLKQNYWREVAFVILGIGVVLVVLVWLESKREGESKPKKRRIVRAKKGKSSK